MYAKFTKNRLNCENMKHIDISTLDELKEALYYDEVRNFIFRKLDFMPVEAMASKAVFKDCIFMGCYLSQDLYEKVQKDNLVISNLSATFRLPKRLYTARDLYEGYVQGKPETFANTYDQRIYRHYISAGKEINSDSNIKEAMIRVLHDHSITDFLHDFIDSFDEKKIVGVMGGHGIERTAPSYMEIVRFSKVLTEKGYLLISGGGPGAMEATHLGAWMAGRSEAETVDAVTMVSKAPSFRDEYWLDVAFQVMEKYPQENGYVSLGIPTFLYGHEPATPFATHIAKYFENSIREDKILTIAKGGIVYTPGSAGTMQEIFQDANQNHYQSFGYASPMVFLGRKFWTEEMPVIPLFEAMIANGRYKNLIISLVDGSDEAVEAILDFTGKA